MEVWELNFEWLRVRHLVKEQLSIERLPNLNAILLLIGVQELGRWKSNFSKEEKQDLMHIAVCRLMSYDGHYTFVGRDEDGWPHWELIKAVPPQTVKEQERLLKRHVITYFNDWETENQTENIDKI